MDGRIADGRSLTRPRPVPRIAFDCDVLNAMACECEGTSHDEPSNKINPIITKLSIPVPFGPWDSAFPAHSIYSTTVAKFVYVCGGECATN